MATPTHYSINFLCKSVQWCSYLSMLILFSWNKTLVYGQMQSALLCRLPKDSGFICPFERTLPMYYYDIMKRECMQFLFHGCGGNGNRFSSLEECEVGCAPLSQCPKGEPLTDWAGNFKQCTKQIPCPENYKCVQSSSTFNVCCPTLNSVCNQPVLSGSDCGVAAVSKFFYDSSARVCRQFTYRGCSGNNNNFETLGECMQYCNSEVICLKGSPATEPGQPSLLYRCNENNDCPQFHECVRRDQKTYCCPSRKHICAQELNEGLRCAVGSEEQRWHFEEKQGLCIEFTYTGCYGNQNNFRTSEQCQDFCFGRCPGEAEMHYNSVTNQPQLCQPRMELACPIGYICSTSSIPGLHICCKTPPQCPKPESILLFDDVINPLSQIIIPRLPRKCSPDVENPCPDKFACTASTNGEYVCCTQPIECPHGMKTLRDTTDGQPRQCTVGVPGTCPSPYGCTAVENGSGRYVCCKPFQQCLMPYLNPANKQALACSPGRMECPKNTYCLALKTSINMHYRNIDIFEAAADAVPILDPSRVEFDDPFFELQDAGDIDYYCCYDMTHAYCTNGQPAYTQINKTQHRTCVKGNPFACPSDMTCQRLVDGRYGCCTSPMAQQVCTIAYVDSDTWKAVTCDGVTDFSCPLDSVCKKAANMKYYCCNEWITGPYEDALTWRFSHDPQFNNTHNNLTSQSHLQSFGEGVVLD